MNASSRKRGFAGLNKNESKYFNAASKMQKSLISLLDKKEFDQITVKEICENAHVNRSTFYLHYDNVNDLLAETVEETYKDFFNRYGDEISRKIDFEDKSEDELFLITPEYLRPYLEFVEQNRKLYRLMYDKADVMGVENMYEKWFHEIFGPILTRFGVSDEEQPLIMLFFLKGLLAVVTQWLKDDCRMPIDNLIKIIQMCVIKP
jgi:AcrR family transcriptional regulator